MKTIEQQIRERASYQFELQAHKLFLQIVKRLPNFRYALKDELGIGDSTINAVVLAESFDYYEYRLHRGRARLSLLIVQKHNAVVPVDCLEIETGTLYKEGQSPNIDRDDRHRRSQAEKKLLISHLLLETDRGQVELQQMGDRMRQRYLSLKQAYLTPRMGRPIAS